jgi:hypothetical protein
MSYPHSKPISFGDAFLNPAADSIAAFDRSRPFIQSTDGAIDVALRNVPLPDGLLGRLKRLVVTMPDETSGQIDYLGC